MRGFGRSGGKPTIAQASEAVAESESLKEESQAIKDLTYELEEYADDLAALLDGLHLQDVYINAHSMGASVATLFFNRYPERVERGILTCSGVFEYDEKSFSAFHKFGGYVVKFRPKWLSKIPFVDRMFMARFLHSSIPHSERQAFLEDFLEADYDAALGTIFTSVSKAQSEVMPQEFAKLTVPTLLVAGEYDKIIPAEMGRQAAALSDKVEFVMIRNTAHFPMLEDAPTYLQRVQEFLQINTPQPKVG
jgi:proline iminopeptidase